MNHFNKNRILAAESVARSAALLTVRSKKKKPSPSASQEWLRDCQFTFSPMLNLFVVAYDQQLVVSSGRFH